MLNANFGGAFARIWSFARARTSAAAVAQTICVRVALLGLNFGTGVIVARSLGPLGRGEFAAIILWPAFIAGVATLGAPTALRYYSRRRPENAAEYYAAAFVIASVMGMLAGATGATMMPILLHDHTAAVVQTAQAFMAFVPQVLVGMVMTARLEAMGDFRRSILTQLYQTVVILLGLAALRLFNNLNAVTAALAYTVPCAVQGLWLAYSLWPARLDVTTLARDARELLGYGLRSYGTDVVAALATQLDLAVIVLFLTPSVLGYYSVALTLSRLLNVVYLSLVTVVFPRASSLSSEDGIALITRAARLSTAVSAVLGCFFLLVIPVLLPRLYGAEFRTAIPLMPLLTAEAILGGLGTILNAGFLAAGRPLVVTLIEAISVACALVLLFVLVPRMNILGAATALLCAALIRAGTIMTAYRFLLCRSFPRLLPDAADLAYVRVKLAWPLRARAERF
jgi:O-antigen/teichoic acid export membrane protein